MKVYTGPKGGQYKLVKGRKVYLKPEEALVAKGEIKTPSRKKLGKPIPAKGKKLSEKLKDWDMLKPKRGSERERLMQECGPDCFLMPETRNYPICPKCSSKKCKCVPHCKGILSALNRSRMNVGRMIKRGDYEQSKKHKEILILAEKLSKKYGC